MRGERGFTLLEVTIAFVIAALALAALTGGAAAGLKNTQAASQMQDALARARSRLAAAAAAPRPGEQRGADGGGFDYRVLVSPLATLGGEGQPRPVLYRISVEVSWAAEGGRRRVVLGTRRIGTATEAGP